MRRSGFSSTRGGLGCMYPRPAPSCSPRWGAPPAARRPTQYAADGGHVRFLRVPRALNAHGARTAKLAESKQYHTRADGLARSPGRVDWQGGLAGWTGRVARQGGLASLQAVTKLVTSGLTGLRTWSAPGQHVARAQSGRSQQLVGAHAANGQASTHPACEQSADSMRPAW